MLFFFFFRCLFDIVLKKDPYGRCIVVFILVCFYGPYKGDQKAKGYKEAGRDEYENDAHIGNAQKYRDAFFCQMRNVNRSPDLNQFLCTFFAFEALFFNLKERSELMPVVKRTMLTELTGIKIAAITGFNCP